MKGIWLTKNESLQCLKMKQGVFEKTLGQTLKWKIVGSRKKYFVTEAVMPKATRDNYSERLVEVDDDTMQVEDVLGDLTALQGASDDEMKQAQLDNLKARTKLIEEKLENRKQELWSEWNEAFYETFSEAFAKFKNDLISLHLNEDQLSTLNDKLESALKVMQDKLDAMWSKFIKDEEGEEEYK